IFVDRAKHAWPRFTNNQETAASQRKTVTFAINDIGLNSEEWKCTGTGFSSDGPRKRRNHNSTGFGLPPSVNNRTTAFSDNITEPHPSFRVDRFTDAAQQAE